MTREELINKISFSASDEDIDRFRDWRPNPAGGNRLIAKHTKEKALFLYTKAMIDAREEVFGEIS